MIPEIYLGVTWISIFGLWLWIDLACIWKNTIIHRIRVGAGNYQVNKKCLMKICNKLWTDKDWWSTQGSASVGKPFLPLGLEEWVEG